MEPMSASTELWTLGADDASIWLLPGDRWYGGPIPSDTIVQAEAELLAFGHDPSLTFPLMHSTSWRQDEHGLVLTWAGIADTGGDYVRARWPEALPITLEMAREAGKPMRHKANAPALPREWDVLLHAVRHLRFLRDYEDDAAAAMSPAWCAHLDEWTPVLAGLYRPGDGLRGLFTTAS